MKDSTGAGSEQLLVETDSTEAAPKSWAPDGQSIVYAAASANNGNDLWRVTLPDRKSVPLVSTPFSESQGQISPTGRWISYGSNESQTNHVYVRPYPSGDGKWQVSGTGGLTSRWRGDGRELFYTNRPINPALSAVAIDDSRPTVAAGAPRVLFQTLSRNQPSFSRAGHSAVLTFDVSRDGQRFIMPATTSTDPRLPGTYPIVVVQNWMVGLK